MSSLTALPGASSVTATLPSGVSPAASSPSLITADLSSLPGGITVSAVVARYSFISNGGTSATFTVVDAYGSHTVTVGPETGNQNVDVTWNGTGQGAVGAAAGGADVHLGNATYTTTTASPGSYGGGFAGLSQLTITYTTGASLQVTVTSACDGSPIAGATVTLNTGASGTTDSSGQVTFTGLSAGTYTWTTAKTGWTTDTSGSALVGSSGLWSGATALTPTAGCPGRLTVVFLDECTRELLTCVYTSTNDGPSGTGTGFSASLPPGVYVVTPVLAGYTIASGNSFGVSTNHTTTAAIVMRPDGGCAGSLYLTVSDACTGDAISGATFTIDGVAGTATDSSGQSTVTGLIAGTHTLVITRAGYPTLTLTLYISADDIASGKFVTLALAPLAGCGGEGVGTGGGEGGGGGGGGGVSTPRGDCT